MKLVGQYGNEFYGFLFFMMGMVRFYFSPFFLFFPQNFQTNSSINFLLILETIPRVKSSIPTLPNKKKLNTPMNIIIHRVRKHFTIDKGEFMFFL
jgi:hypothetical protein